MPRNRHSWVNPCPPRSLLLSVHMISPTYLRFIGLHSNDSQRLVTVRSFTTTLLCARPCSRNAWTVSESFCNVAEDNRLHSSVRKSWGANSVFKMAFSKTWLLRELVNSPFRHSTVLAVIHC
jgi:hypothetical protein